MTFASALLAVVLHMTPAAPSQTMSRTCLAMVSYTEARGEGAVGMAAVMGVVLNRVADPRWPHTVCAVATQHDQFLGLQHWRGPIDAASWKSALAVADIALSGAPLLPVACRGAVFFTASNSTGACRVGAHVFRTKP